MDCSSKDVFQFAGKEVVLVTTGNSLRAGEIDAFAKRVNAHGGRLARHVTRRSWTGGPSVGHDPRLLPRMSTWRRSAAPRARG
jgi:hypothetical protein